MVPGLPPPASGAPLLEPLAPDPLEVPLVDPLVDPLEAPLPLPLETPLPLAPPSAASEKASPPHPASGRAPKAATISRVRSKVISMYPRPVYGSREPGPPGSAFGP